MLRFMREWWGPVLGGGMVVLIALLALGPLLFVGSALAVTAAAASSRLMARKAGIGKLHEELTGMNLRGFVVGLVALALLLWGPIDHLWPSWLSVRLAYMIVIPALTWFALEALWIIWRPSPTATDLIGASVAAVVAAVLLWGAYWYSQQDTHSECVRWRQTHDGRECIGDEWFVAPGPGPDLVIVALLGAVGTVTLGYAVMIGLGTIVRTSRERVSRAPTPQGFAGAQCECGHRPHQHDRGGGVCFACPCARWQPLVEPVW